MRYETVFEITQIPWQWWWSLCGEPLIAIGVYLIRSKRLWFYGRGTEPPKNPDPDLKLVSKLLSWCFLLFSVGATVMAFWGTRPDYESLRTGSYRVAQGVVDECSAWPDNVRASECFSVDGAPFFSSESTVEAALEQASARGVPIRKGMFVRVAYDGGTDTLRKIYRLEVGVK
jgi:hypothetical protein